MFIENPSFAEQNRINADNFRVVTAQLADGTIGTVAFFGGFMAVLTDREALDVAHKIINQVENR